MGLISPLGNSPEKLWSALASGTSGVGELTAVPGEALPTRFGAEAREFSGAIEDFGPLDKAMSRTIKKALKAMCREMQMGIAAAQLTLNHCGINLAAADRDRVGVLYGSDYMLTLPQEFAAGVRPIFGSGASKGCPRSSRCGCSSICPTCRPATLRSSTTCAGRTTR
jgi:3-oxoacyl-[acyl-carrier-protein] synthase II